jgi:hypothetical protein
MLSKAVKARQRYNRYRRLKSIKRGRRMAIKACDWIYRSWFMREPVGPFRDATDHQDTVIHQLGFLKGFRSRLKQFVARQVVWHHRGAYRNNKTPYELALEFKRFLTQDLNVRIGQSYVP